MDFLPAYLPTYLLPRAQAQAQAEAKGSPSRDGRRSLTKARGPSLPTYTLEVLTWKERYDSYDHGSRRVSPSTPPFYSTPSPSLLPFPHTRSL